MRHSRIPIILTFLSLALVLGGCLAPTLPPGDSTSSVARPGDYDLTGSSNYVTTATGSDLYPLFVGARWLYRNAASFWNPEIASSGLLETEVVAIVQARDAQCYVLQSRYSNGPDELLYVHRTGTQVQLLAEQPVVATGAQPDYSLHPGLAVLKLPLAEDKSWPLETTAGVGEAYVYHTEVVAMEAGVVKTLLGTYSPIFTDAWRVHYELPAGGPRFYGGSVQYLWYVPGVGVAKHVLNSVDYELAEFRLPEEIVSLTRYDDGRTTSLPNGGMAFVQLRGDADPLDGWAWHLTEMDGASLEFLSETFYGDIYPAGTSTGTYAYQFRSIAPGTTTLVFELMHAATGTIGNRVELTVVVEFGL